MLPTESPHIAQYFDAYSIPSRLQVTAGAPGTCETLKDDITGNENDLKTSDSMHNQSEYRAPASFFKLASAKKSSMKKPRRTA